MRRMPSVFVTTVCFIIAGCAAGGFNSVQKLNQITPGMSSEEVISILGQPNSSQMTEDKWVLKYSLHEKWKGNVPYYMVFNKDSKQLETWYENEAEYQRNQAQMQQMMKPLLEAQNSGTAQAGPNDPDLQKWITGNYYSFSSSMVVSAASERSLTLCVNGKFRISSESSYSSNRNSDGTTNWGAANQSGDSGTWAISGNRQSGTITLNYSNGNTQSMKYQVGSEDQVMYFDGVKFAYAGVANCD